MTAIEKLKLAFEAQAQRNVDLHEEFVLVGTSVLGNESAELLMAQEPADYGEDENEPEPLTVFDVLEAIREIEELEKREPLPFKQVHTDPGEAYLALLAEWQSDKANLAYYKAVEREKRVTLFGATFTQPKEGTNRHKLPDGREVVGKYPINRKLDEAALPVTLQAMRERGVANTDALVNYKPTLAKREWNTLSEENKLLFSPAIIATPGTPQLEVEEPKAPKR